MTCVKDMGVHWASMVLGTDYREFASEAGIRGLYKTSDKRIDLLTLLASTPGNGQFRKFMGELKDEFDTIFIWCVFNPVLPRVLERYGFVPTTQSEPDGEVIEGFVWVKAAT